MWDGWQYCDLCIIPAVRQPFSFSRFNVTVQPKVSDWG